MIFLIIKNISDKFFHSHLRFNENLQIACELIFLLNKSWSFLPNNIVYLSPLSCCYMIINNIIK